MFPDFLWKETLEHFENFMLVWIFLYIIHWWAKLRNGKYFRTFLWKHRTKSGQLFTIYGHCSGMGPEISLYILVGIAKPAGCVKARIKLFILFPYSTHLLVNNLVVSCWFLGEMSEHHRLDEGMRWRIVSRFEAGQS